MLAQINDLLALALGSNDGAIGEVKDLLFDDETWTIRYLVAKTGSWLSSRKVLISTIAVSRPDWAGKLLPLSLTHEQIRSSPDIDTDMPITRQHETDCLDHYSYPYYWGGMDLWGSGGYPSMLMPAYAGYGSAAAVCAESDAAQARAETRQRDGDPPLAQLQSRCWVRHRSQ